MFDYEYTLFEFVLASMLALSGCGCGCGCDSDNSSKAPSNPVKPTPDKPLLEQVENQLFGFAFDGTANLSNIYDADAVVQRLVVDTNGEY